LRWKITRPERPIEESALFAQTKSCHNLAIPIRVSPIQIVQQPAALVDHHDQPAARSVIFCVGLEVGREVVDSLAQQRDLHFRRSGVFRVNPVHLDYTGFGFHQLNLPLKRRAPALYSSLFNLKMLAQSLWAAKEKYRIHLSLSAAVGRRRDRMMRRTT
jgi:hypothetical protein